MTAADSLVVNYVSLPPGAGKTQAAIAMLRKHATRKLKAARYAFYVAPTVQLMGQTHAGLMRVLRDEHKPLVRAVFSEGIGSVTVAQQIKNILAGYSNDGTRLEPWVPGSIIFMTHAAFLALGDNKAVHSRCLVIFDESRKWTASCGSIELGGGVQELFDAMFDHEPLVSENETYDHLRVLTAKPIPENKKVTLLRDKVSAAAFSQLDALHKAIQCTSDDISRMKGYAVFRGAGVKRELFSIQLPSHPLRGFKVVYILSADFETSQMFNLLRLEDTRMVNCSRVFMDEHAKLGYDRSVRRAQARYDYLTITSLLADNTMPSLSRMKEARCIVPRHNLIHVGRFMRDNGLNTTDLDSAVRAHLSGGNFQQSARRRGLLQCVIDQGGKFDQMEWLAKSAVRVAHGWLKKNPCDTKPLLFANHQFNGTLGRTMSERFTMMNHAKAEGDNTQRGSNMVLFMAAVNPTPELGQLLTALLGHLGYNSDDDFAVDKAIQCIGRGNIRVHGIKDAMLAVFLTHGMANKVHARLLGRPALNTEVCRKLGNYHYWNYRTYQALETESGKQEKPKRHTQTPEQRAHLKRLLARAIKARSAQRYDDERKLRDEHRELSERIKRGEAVTIPAK